VSASFWYVIGFASSVIMLHIATLLLLDTPSLAKAAAVSGVAWLLCGLFTALRLPGALFCLVSLIVGCIMVKRLYEVSIGMALIVFVAHAFVEVALILVLWFVFHIEPRLQSRAHIVERTSTTTSTAVARDARITLPFPRGVVMTTSREVNDA
jgi:uncharacterized membrane protein